MAYKYYNVLNSMSSSPSQLWKDDLQALINFEFENASTVNTVEEEMNFGSLDFSPTRARITHVINSDTGEKLGDDFRGLIFSNLDHVYGLGYRYRFSDNIWLTINSDLYKFPTASTVIRRCNNTMNTNEDGEIHREPCIIDYTAKNNDFEYQENIILNSGDIKIIIQSNSITNKYKINDRFLFGVENNLIAYRIRYINGFLNKNTYQDNPSLLYLILNVDKVGANDDLVNRVAYNSPSSSSSSSGSTLW